MADRKPMEPADAAVVGRPVDEMPTASGACFDGCCVVEIFIA